MSDDGSPTDRQVALGQPVYDESGNTLGTIRGLDEHGFYVTAEEGLDGLSIEHVRSGHELGEAELMWRCWNCGEMGRIDDDLPDTCPGCGARKEELYYWTED